MGSDDEEPVTDQEVLLQIWSQLDAIHRDLRPITFLAWLMLLGVAIGVVAGIAHLAGGG